MRRIAKSRNSGLHLEDRVRREVRGVVRQHAVQREDDAACAGRGADQRTRAGVAQRSSNDAGDGGVAEAPIRRRRPAARARRRCRPSRSRATRIAGNGLGQAHPGSPPGAPSTSRARAPPNSGRVELMPTRPVETMHDLVDVGQRLDQRQRANGAPVQNRRLAPRDLARDLRARRARHRRNCARSAQRSVSPSAFDGRPLPASIRQTLRPFCRASPTSRSPMIAASRGSETAARSTMRERPSAMSATI